MLSNLESTDLLKKIFLLLNRYMLQLIKYNKSLQSKLSIDINKYKKEAGFYRIIDNDGKGKEYKIITNDLIFEGEFKNKQRNGFGREYNNGKFIFEGEFKDDKRNGYGKEYRGGKIVIFEGQFLNGERWEGIGKEFNLINDNIEFEGEYKRGKREGKGKEYFNENRIILEDIINEHTTKYEGNYLDGEREMVKELNILKVVG